MRGGKGENGGAKPTTMGAVYFPGHNGTKHRQVRIAIIRRGGGEKEAPVM